LGKRTVGEVLLGTAEEAVHQGRKGGKTEGTGKRVKRKAEKRPK